VTTIPEERLSIIPEREPQLPKVPFSESTSTTSLEPDLDTAHLIAAISAKFMELDLMERGYEEMSEELLEWSETALLAQAETLPEE